MRILAFSLVAVVLLFTPALALASSCSCTAPDGSCNTSVTCTGGCWAICGTEGKCGSGCSNTQTPRPENQYLSTPPAADEDRLALTAQHLTGSDLSLLLSEHLGHEVSFVPLRPGETFSIDVSGMPPGQLLIALAEFGAVATSHAEVPDHAQGAASHRVPDTDITLKIDSVRGGEVAGVLNAFLARTGLTLVAGNPDEELSVDVQGMDLETFLQGLQATTSLKLVSDAP